jgi:hypothetical protein
VEGVSTATHVSRARGRVSAYHGPPPRNAAAEATPAGVTQGRTGSATGKSRNRANLPALQQRPGLRVIDGDESACFRDDRWCWLYTAITRGMKRVVMVRL